MEKDNAEILKQALKIQNDIIDKITAIYNIDKLTAMNAKLLLGFFDGDQYPDEILSTRKKTIRFTWYITVDKCKYYLEMEIGRTTINCLFVRKDDLKNALTKTITVRDSNLSPDFNDDVRVSIRGIINAFCFARTVNDDGSIS